MSEIFAMVEGEFGKVVVLEVRHSLVSHAHSEIQMSYWLGGGLCQGLVGDTHVVCNDSMAIGINRYQAHDMTLAPDAEPCMMLLIYMHEHWFDAHITPIVFRNAQLNVTEAVRTKYCALMQKMLFAWHADHAQIDDDVKALIQLTVQTNHHAVHPYPNVMRRKMVDYRLRLALSHMRDNIAKANLIKTLAKTVGLSRSRLYELFKKELQSSPKLVYNSVLIDAAISDMRQPATDLSVLAAKFGFSTAANFSRFFRSHKGVTPSAYRKKMRISASHESTKA